MTLGSSRGKFFLTYTSYKTDNQLLLMTGGDFYFFFYSLSMEENNLIKLLQDILADHFFEIS